jgi:hypothetical protein
LRASTQNGTSFLTQVRDWRAQSALNLLVRALLLQFLCSTEQGRARCGRLSTPQTALVMSCLSPRNNNKTSSSSQTIITMITTIASDRITCAVSSRLVSPCSLQRLCSGRAQHHGGRLTTPKTQVLAGKTMTTPSSLTIITTIETITSNHITHNVSSLLAFQHK